MNFFEMVLRSPGWIFGPMMLFAGLAAIVACARATRRSDRAAAHRALVWSLLPPVLGVAGALFGGTLWALSGQVMPDPTRAWMALGCTIVFGVFVALIPALWSLVLLRQRPTAIA